MMPGQMAGCNHSDMELQGHCQCLSNPLGKGWSHNGAGQHWDMEVWDSTAAQPGATPGSGRRWLTRLGLDAGMSSDHSMGF